MGYFSVFTAYLVTAYVVGSDMTRYQVVAVTGLFLVMQLFLTWGVWVFFNTAREYRSLAGEYTVPIPPGNVALFLLSIGVIAGLKFMWDVKHPKAE
jgi:hypothetical protein